jgi:hypothetical protein
LPLQSPAIETAIGNRLARSSHRKTYRKPVRKIQLSKIVAETSIFQLGHCKNIAKDIFQPCHRKSQTMPASFSTANEKHRKRHRLALPRKTAAKTGIFQHGHRKTLTSA